MALDSTTTKAIATEAWSQLVYSIISDNPPSDMAPEYYHTFPEVGFDALQKQLKRLEIYTYRLGTESIQARLSSSIRPNEHDNRLGIKHVRGSISSNKHYEIVRVNEDANSSGSIKGHGETRVPSKFFFHIFSLLKFLQKYKSVPIKFKNKRVSFENIRAPSDLVSPKEKFLNPPLDANQQDIEHIQGCIRSNKHSVPVRANEDENQQDIEHIQGCIRSNKHSVPVQANEDENGHGIEHVQSCIRSNKQFEQVQAYDFENRQGTEHIRGCIRSDKHSEMVQGNEDENWHGIEHIRDCIRSNKYFEVVQANEDKNKQGMEHIQDTLRSGMYHELVQENKHKNQQGFKRIQDNARSAMFNVPADHENHPSINYSESLRSTGLPKPLYKLENEYRHLLNYGQAKKMSTLFDELLELVENKDFHGEEKLTLRIQVLKVVKLIHHYGIDTIRTGVEEELEDMNQKYDDIKKNLALLYKKKGLEVMLRICDTEACQRTIYEIIGKAERDQVFYKW